MHSVHTNYTSNTHICQDFDADFFASDDYLTQNSTEPADDAPEPDRNSSEMVEARSIYQRAGGTKPMTEQEARQCVKRLRFHFKTAQQHLAELRACLLEFSEREGWRVVKDKKGRRYSNFEEFCLSAFSYRQSSVSNKLIAARIDRHFTRGLDYKPLSETAAIALNRFSSEHWDTIYYEAKRCNDHKQFPTKDDLLDAAKDLRIVPNPVQSEEDKTNTAQESRESQMRTNCRKPLAPRYDQHNKILIGCVRTAYGVEPFRFTLEELIALGVPIETPDEVDESNSLMSAEITATHLFTEEDNEDEFACAEFLTNSADFSPSVRATGYQSCDGRSHEIVSMEFEAFWSIYPETHRVEREKTFTAFLEARRDVTFAVIGQALGAWIAAEDWQNPNQIECCLYWLRDKTWQYIPTDYRSSDGKTRREVESEFEEFWAEYPKQIGKPLALCAFLESRRDTSFQTLIGGLEWWIDSDDWSPNDQYIQSPQKWLSGEYWRQAYEG